MGINLNIRPLHDRVVVEREDEELKSAGGIVIPDTAAEKPSRGKIIAVGKGRQLDGGKIQALDVKIGDNILFGKYAGTEIKLNGHEFIVMREDDIMGIIE